MLHVGMPVQRAVLALLCTLVGLVAFAHPPGHAKAHGWRKKHEHEHAPVHVVGYTGAQWEHHYGVVDGHCNRDEIGTVLGAVVGGAIGSQVGDGSGRTVAIVVGSVLGALVGREIGRDMDERDRACFGHSLELLRPGQSVRWLNDRTQVTYVLTPLAAGRGDSAQCRRFNLQTTYEGRSRTSEGQWSPLACSEDSETPGPRWRLTCWGTGASGCPWDTPCVSGGAGASADSGWDCRWGSSVWA